MGNVQFDSLELENQNFLEKNVNFLLECLDDLTQEQQKLQYYERQAIRQQQAQKNFVEKRRAENNLRAERGQDLLGNRRRPRSSVSNYQVNWRRSSYPIRSRPIASRSIH